jgi:hypothetical protein
MQKTTNYKVKEQYEEAVIEIVDYIKKSKNVIDSVRISNLFSEKDSILDYTIFINLLSEKMSNEKILFTGYVLERIDHYKASCSEQNIQKLMHQNGPLPEQIDFEFKIFWNKDSREFEAKQKEADEIFQQTVEKFNKEMKLLFGKKQ